MSIKVKQHDIRDCGAACLASIASHYKLKLPIARIRQFAHTDKRGTNMLGLQQGAEKMGFTAKGVKGGIDALPQIPLPAIAHRLSTIKNADTIFVLNDGELVENGNHDELINNKNQYYDLWQNINI